MSISSGVDTLFNSIGSVQTELIEAQSNLVIGPVLFSPLSLIVSVAQVIAGLAGFIFFGLIATFTAFLHLNNARDWAIELATTGLRHFYGGTSGISFAAWNMLTLGIPLYLKKHK